MTAKCIEIAGQPSGVRQKLLIGSAAFWLIATPQSVVHAAETGSTPAAAPSPCTLRLPGHSTQEFECRLDPAVAARSLRFKVFFSGSHDDTRATLEATLNGAPLDCADGSKTNTEGEDGEVSLDCRFTVAGNPAAHDVLRVALRWHHAQYMGFELKAD